MGAHRGGQGAALELLRGTVRCTAPALIQIELAGAVIRRFRTKAMTKDQARAAQAKWDTLASSVFVKLLSQAELFDDAVEIAFSIDHPLPDCLYLAAAKMLDCPLITADRSLHERGRQVYKRIELLARAA